MSTNWLLWIEVICSFCSNLRSICPQERSRSPAFCMRNPSLQPYQRSELLMPRCMNAPTAALKLLTPRFVTRQAHTATPIIQPPNTSPQAPLLELNKTGRGGCRALVPPSCQYTGTQCTSPCRSQSSTRSARYLMHRQSPRALRCVRACRARRSPHLLPWQPVLRPHPRRTRT